MLKHISKVGKPYGFDIYNSPYYFLPNFENYMSSIDHEIYQNLSLNAGCLLIGEKHTQQEEGKYYIPLQR